MIKKNEKIQIIINDFCKILNFKVINQGNINKSSISNNKNIKANI